MRLAEVLGHAPPRALLLRAVMASSVPQSLLFDGPEGVGKRTTALALATAINCQQPGSDGDGDGCGTCSSCRRIARAQHPDVVALVPNEKGTITVEMAREVIGQAGYRPFEARRRVVIIDDADSLQAAAQNALLKTLEEPPPSSMFVLVTARPDSLLQTVLSRCPRIRFGRLGPANSRAGPRPTLRRQGRRGDRTRGHGRWERLASARAGHRRTRRGTHSRHGAAARRGQPPAHRREAQAGAAARGNPRKRGAGTDREVLSRRLEALSLLVRDMGVVSAPPAGAAGGDAALANQDLGRDLAGMARYFDTARVLNSFAVVEQARRSLDRYQSAKVVADWLACEM